MNAHRRREAKRARRRARIDSDLRPRRCRYDKRQWRVLWAIMEWQGDGKPCPRRDVRAARAKRVSA